MVGSKLQVAITAHCSCEVRERFLHGHKGKMARLIAQQQLGLGSRKQAASCFLLLAISSGPCCCLPVHRFHFQSTENAQQVGKLAVGKSGAGRKPSGTFVWMVWHHSLDRKVKLLSLWGVRSWQWKGSGALSSFAGVLFIKQLLCARHPSWVLGTQRYAAYPLHIWELAHGPTK